MIESPARVLFFGIEVQEDRKMPDVASVIESKVKAFAKDINKFLDAKRDAKVKALTKAGDPKADEKVVKVSFKYSGAKGSISRSPEQQAENVAKGTSWTCAGAHMVDKARHVAMYYGPAGKKPKISWAVGEAFGSKDQHFVAMSDLKNKWKALMKTHGLKNHKGGDGWGAGDAFHFELPDSKVPRSDKRVQACLAHYAKLTRIDGKPKNTSFETGSWKSDLKPHLEKAEKKHAEAEKKKRQAELKKLRFDGQLKGKETLMSGVNASKTVTGKSWGTIDVPSPIDSGAGKTRNVSGGGARQWDSLARSIFEALGLAETKGFDVKLSCGVTYKLITYQNLGQSFIAEVTPTCAVIYNTPVARAMKMKVDVSGEVGLSKSQTEPTGKLVFKYVLTSPVDTEKGQIVLSIKGGKVTSAVK